MLAKSFAYGVINNNLRRWHLEDLTTLATLIRISDRVGEGLNRKENGKLSTACAAALFDPVANDSDAQLVVSPDCAKLPGRI